MARFAMGLALGCAVSPRAAAADFSALTNYSVRTWQVDDGLPDSSVKTVLQDGRGYIWLATIEGLVRFDGVEFKQYSSPLVVGTAARNIRALVKEDNHTLLMLPASGGVVRLRDGVFTLHPMSAALSDKQLDALFVDPDGAVWVGISDGSAVRWKNGKLENFGADQGLNRTGGRVSFAADGEGRVWVSSGGFLGYYLKGQLVRFEASTGTAHFAASSRSGGVWLWNGDRLEKVSNGKGSVVCTNLPWTAVGGFVRDMYEDRDGLLWIGTGAQGLYRFVDGAFTHVPTSHNGINSIAEDREGNLWVGTAGGGVNELRQKIFSVYDTRSGLLEDVSDAVCMDKQGDVWFANRSGGLGRLSDGEMNVVRFQDGRLKLNINTVCADDDGQVWLGTGNGLYRFQRDAPQRVEQMGTGISSVHVLFKSRSGDVWVGADPRTLGFFHAGKFKALGPEAGFTGRTVRAITEDPAGRIWIGTEVGRLFQFADGKFTEFGPPDGLPAAPIRTLWAGPRGSIWIGTIGGGLLLRRNDHFSRITTSNGLPDDIIAEVIGDNDGRLWCGSRRGIFHVLQSDVVAFTSGRIPQVTGVTFGRSEGLGGVYCAGSCQPMAWRADDGRLWFSTQQGVLSVDSSALKPNTVPPAVLVDQFLVNDAPFSMDEVTRVPAAPKKLEFRFSALSFTAPEKVRVRYQLEDVDSGWIETANRSAVYAGLAPGDYRLRVSACNDDGVWNDTGATLAFTVRPAWWQNWWVRGTGLVLFTFTVVLSVRYWSHRRLKMRLERLEYQRALEKERVRIARDLHDDLGASLTQLGLQAEMSRRETIPPDELRNQSALLATRVRTLAHELDAIVWSVNPKNDSLDKLATYLCQFSQEFFRLSPVRCRLDVAEDIPAFPLTPDVRHDLFMVAKEAMNNVVKHSGATEVWLRLGMERGAFVLRLEDNGKGFDPAAQADSERNGLRNMRTRLEEFGGSFEIQSRPGKGTVLTARLPLMSPVSGNGGNHSVGGLNPSTQR